ncbi:MAG: hypothetical protein CL687_05310 [Candidatus Pelagibacter sp.]|nr:hypothetical protein [Candidatus Pelagibacter sp.]|tara:strand:- start:375 stop:758 length:384 start_codon:yes stop_codon:yes gene_type:complete
MKNFLLLFIGIFYFASALAGGHITKAEKKQVIECLGHYSATAVLPAETIEVKNMELALASVKVIREYLSSEGVKDDEMNKGMNTYVDKVYGEPFNKVKNDECNKFIFKQIKGSKNKIEELSRTIYAG